MGGPQLEDGYTRISNEILEEVYKKGFNGTQLGIILLIWRQTYGFQRKGHELSERFISNAIKRHRNQVASELTRLIDMGVIKVISPATFTKSRVLSFNKCYKEWKCKEGLALNSVPPTKDATSPVTKLSATPGTEFSAKRKKDFKESIKENNTVQKADALALFERLWKLYPEKKGKGKVSDTQKKKLLAVGEEELVVAIDRYLADLKKDDWRKPQNGSTFFNSGYIDYLDKNYETNKFNQEVAPAQESVVRRNGRIIE